MPKRFKAMSPGSMSLPTHSTWEMGQGLSPYAPLPPLDMKRKYTANKYSAQKITFLIVPFVQYSDIKWKFCQFQ